MSTRTRTSIPSITARSIRSTTPVQEPRTSSTLWVVCAAATVAWGAGAFGAIYPWGYIPLLAASALLGGSGLLFGRGPVPWPMVAALSLVSLAIAAQLVPLSAAILADLSPRALDIYR